MQNSNIKDFVKQPLVSDKDSENTYQGVLSLTQNQINEKIQVGMLSPLLTTILNLFRAWLWQ